MNPASNTATVDIAAADAASTAGDVVSLRAFEPRDLVAAHALSTASRWSHRLEDWQFALSLGQGVVAERHGKVLGTALFWEWGEAHATIGLVIVAPELQGQRIGNRMMERVLDQLSGRDVLLHSTVAGRGLYERLGFSTTGEVAQHLGTVAVLPERTVHDGDRLRPLAGGDVESLIAMDALGAGMPRGPLIRSLFAHEKTVVLERDGLPVGFAIRRRFGRGHVVGPVIAPDLDAARHLIAECCHGVTGVMRIDVDAMSGLTPWLESIGLPRVGGVKIMVRGAVPARGPAQGGWALVTQAIG